MNTTTLPSLALLAAIGLAGCASPPPPDPALAAGAASIEAARAAGAPDLAAPEIDQARGKLDHARQLAREGHKREAVRLAEEADVDAQYARAKAGSERSRKALAEVEASLRSLHEELSRDTAPRQPS